MISQKFPTEISSFRSAIFAEKFNFCLHFFYFNNIGKLDRCFEHGNCYLEYSSKFNPGSKNSYDINLFDSFSRVEIFSLDWKSPYNKSLKILLQIISVFFLRSSGLEKHKKFTYYFLVFVLYLLHDWHICNHVKFNETNHKQPNNYQLKYLLLLLIFTNNYKMKVDNHVQDDLKTTSSWNTRN